MALTSYIITFFLLIGSLNEAAKILAIFPIPSISHQVVFRPLTQELAKRGHEVTVITPDPVFPKGGTPPNLTEIDVHDISYKIWIEKFMSAEISKGSANDLQEQMKAILDAMAAIVDVVLDNDEVQNMIQNKKQKFDLVLSEACVRSALIMSHIYKVPAIQVSSFGAVFDNYEIVGAPSHPFLYSPVTYQRLNNLTIWEKITELYNDYLFRNVYQSMEETENNMLKKHVKNAPDVAELYNNVHMLFLNINPIFEGIRPVPPNVIYMGGLHQKPDKDLPVDLKEYLDSSKNGVIYLSFGTNVDPSLLPPEKIQTLIQTFSKLPYDVLWKWNKDELPGRTANIKISKWLPQSDLLKHSKIKLFVTQGGLQSTDEAITAGVPLIGMPMLGDQWFNVEKYEYLKIGVRLDMETITVEKFTETINKVIQDESYRHNIIKVRDIMRDQPMKPLERAVWWTEYVIRHGGAGHLRSPGANISWSQYLELELVSFVLAIVLAAVLLLFLAIRIVYNFTLKYYVNIKVKSA